MASVADLMQKDVKKVPNTTTVKKAAVMMKSGKIGSLLVQKKRDLVGIVTETDIVRRAVATGADLDKLTVEKIMTSPIVTIAAHQSAQDAHDLMGDLGVRHLGVTEGGKLVGVISVRDLLIYFKRYTEPRITQD